MSDRPDSLTLDSKMTNNSSKYETFRITHRSTKQLHSTIVHEARRQRILQRMQHDSRAQSASKRYTGKTVRDDRPLAPSPLVAKSKSEKGPRVHPLKRYKEKKPSRMVFEKRSGYDQIAAIRLVSLSEPPSDADDEADPFSTEPLDQVAQLEQDMTLFGLE